MMKYGVSVYEATRGELIQAKDSLIEKVVTSFCKVIGEEFKEDIKRAVIHNGYEETKHDEFVQWVFVVEFDEKSGEVVVDMDKSANKFLYSFGWDYGRSGSLDGLFVATEKEVANAIGQEVNFGEALGKHSEVYGILEEGNISKLDVSSEAVEEVSKHLGSDWSGYNPLDYVRTMCEECEDSFNKDDGEVEFRAEYDKVMCTYCVRDKEEEDDEMNGE